MAIKKSDSPSLVLRKKSAHRETISLQFDELCGLLKGQYTSLEVTHPGGVRLMDGDELKATLRDARPVQVKDCLGRSMGRTSEYYVARMGGR